MEDPPHPKRKKGTAMEALTAEEFIGARTVKIELLDVQENGRQDNGSAHLRVTVDDQPVSPNDLVLWVGDTAQVTL